MSGSNKKSEKTNLKKEIFDWMSAIFISFFLAFLLRSFVFSLAYVSGESMDPTLKEGDKLYINKFIYTPKKGDIVAFLPEFEKNRIYIKRVIATEGDKLYIDFYEGKVYLNDNLLEESYISGPTVIPEKYIEDLMESGEYDKNHPIVIEKDQVFCMGDNRSKSYDCRGFGPIKTKTIKGKAVFRLWPLKKFGSLYEKAKAVSMPNSCLHHLSQSKFHFYYESFS